MIAGDSPYVQQQFARRRRYPFPNQTEVYLAAPEDLVISKLRWHGESEKQRRDVLAILKVQQDALDYVYMYQWAAEFGLDEVLDELAIAAGVMALVTAQRTAFE
ncbi:MAG: hypothetical protein HLUCCA11_01815 [Phormidesmis priestleyi Ana]|uniref:Uncharacterized protein n=1 Tax=Phormidesmis priestleyi Ana TaxID=1666911 RepID=A0A0P7Z2L2_9CYAN|nr:MAG: hypothetical protein HLUCCA11_01815 [Phormidesmis priestleyi Ana]